MIAKPKNERAKLAGTTGAAARDAGRRGGPGAAGALVAAGHDLVYLPDLAPRLRPRFVARAYTGGEAAEAGALPDPLPFFGTRWAAKEAAYKAFCDLVAALGRAPDGLACVRNYEVSRRAGTVIPELVLHGAPADLLAELARGADVAVSLSLTDERDYAAAFVVISVVPQRSGGRNT